MQGRGAWRAAVQGVAEGQTRLSKSGSQEQRESGGDGANSVRGHALRVRQTLQKHSDGGRGLRKAKAQEQQGAAL